MTKNLCIIPARGGSKRIPRKNIKNFLGKPIIAYSIEAAIKSGLFDEVMVSTEDKEIGGIAEKHGAKIPFFRSEENADDHATTVDVLVEVINGYENLNQRFENICCIYPCAPFVTYEKLRIAYDLMLKKNIDSVFPVMPFSFPIQRALRVKDSKPSFFYPHFKNSRSQDLEETFHDAGQFYFVKTNALLENNNIFSDNTGVINISPLEGQDIDNVSDWKLAELKYQLLHG